MGTSRASLRRFSAVLGIAALVTATAFATVFVAPGSAHADTAPPPGQPATVSADALPTVQQNGVVWDQVTVGNIVYATGSFSQTWPAGLTNTAANDTPRANLLAFDIRTGALITSFNHTLNAQGLVITASPDGSRVYVGGDFTQVDGLTRNHVAAFDTATGALVSSFAPNVGARVAGLAATNSTLYVGGQFLSIGATARTRLAAFQTSNGALTSWAPSADDGQGVTALAVTPDGSQVVIGGSFSTLNGTVATSIGSVTTATPATVVPYQINQYVHDCTNPNATCYTSSTGNGAGITSLISDGTSIYGSGYSYGAGNFEGSFAIDPNTGAIQTLNDCHGDTYGVQPVGGVLYTVSHAHDCSAIGSFPDVTPRINYHALAFTTAATGTNSGPDAYGWNYSGVPDSTLLPWLPLFAIGTVTGQNQAAWAVTGNSNYIALGGEFPSVNGTAQAGLVRFAISSLAPNKMGPVNGTYLNAKAISFSAGTARISWQADYDRDNATLTYNVYRDGGSTPVYTTTQTSAAWNLPAMGWVDTGLVPGSTHSYRVQAVDPFGNKLSGNTTSVTIASTGQTSTYVKDVTGDGAADLWRFNEASGTTAYDWAGFSDMTNEGSGVAEGATGPIIGDSSTAATFSGTSSGTASTTQAITGPNTFSIEAWFKTTTGGGGKIVGFGSSTAPTSSSSYDRQIYMTNAGKLIFGVYNGGTYTVQSATSYNDGQWHHVVGELSGAGLAMFVDGAPVGQNGGTTVAQTYSGYWRIGGDNLGGWPSKPSSNYFKGTIANVAVYPAALTLSQVQKHYTDAGYTPAAPPAPTDSYGAAAYADSPTTYWRLDETRGSTAADTSPYGDSGLYSGGVTKGVASNVSGSTGTAVTLDGSTGLISSTQSFTNPTVYSETMWFKTTTTTGGKLIGFGSSQTGLSSNYDRHVYMLDTGQLSFGTYTGQTNTVVSPQSYNDGKWHFLVATQGTAGMVLYVDGQSVGTNPQTQAQSYTGYWRVGGDNTWGGATSNYFAGTVDEVAIFGSQLSAGQVSSLYAASPAAVIPPTASIATPSCTYMSCSFDGTGSTPAAGTTITGYSWDFGDGTSPATGATPTHTFALPGSYTVTLTVTGSNGASSRATTSVTATLPPSPPTAVQATPNCTYLSCAFDASGSTAMPGATITKYSWDFGDGSAAGSGATPTHAYAAAGTYTATVTVTDSNGNTNTASKTVTVTAPPPPTAAQATPNCTYLSCAFDASGSTAVTGATITGYSWDFGDGSAAGSGATPTHAYAAAGTYTATVTVTDSNGNTNTASNTVTVTAPPNPTAAQATPSCTNLSCSFDASGSTAPTGATITGYSWNFGDGSAAGSGATPTHTYSVAGTYTATVTVTDTNGNTDTASKDVTVTAPPGPPSAAFTSSCTALSCSFDGTSSVDASGTPISSYSWTFMSGQTGSGATPSFTFPAAGVYPVTLKVTDANGSDTVTHNVTVSAPANPTINLLASDGFNRTVTGGWGTAPTGGAWSPTGSSANLSVSGGAGVINMPSPGTGPGVYLGSVSSSDTNTTATFTANAAPSGNGLYVDIIGRRISSNTDYRGRVILGSNGSVSLALLRISAGVQGTVKTTTVVSGLSFAPGTQLNVQLQVTGTSPTTMQMKVWAVGSAYPSNWQITGTDTTSGMQVSGSVGIAGYLPGNATVSPVALRVSSFAAGPTVGLPTAAAAVSCTGDTCSADGTGSTDPSGTISSYTWVWGDGTVTTGATSSHTYANGGTYTVTLTVKNPSGYTDTKTSQVTVP